MRESTVPTPHLEARQSVTREDLLALAKLYDEHARVVSFYFSLASTPDNSHREETLMIKQLVREIVTKPGTADGLSDDLGAIDRAAEEVRHAPSRLRAIFACHNQHVWQEFDLPALGSVSRLEVGRHPHLAPLLQALESCTPYCVVMVENGKARGFVVHGADIREIRGRFKAEDLSLYADDSRVGWSHHIEDNLQEHAKAYLKKLSPEIHRFMEEHECSSLVIGCRDDLWSGLEPQMLSPETTAVIGRFHAANFDVCPDEVLHVAQPIFEESLRRHYEDLVHQIDEGSSHSVLGLDQVLECLEQGRVQKVLLGKKSDELASECRQCGHLQAGIQDKCVFCGSLNTQAVLAQEALIRKALFTGAEVLLPGLGANGCDSVAAWLRY